MISPIYIYYVEVGCLRLQSTSRGRFANKKKVNPLSAKKVTVSPKENIFLIVTFYDNDSIRHYKQIIGKKPALCMVKYEFQQLGAD